MSVTFCYILLSSLCGMNYSQSKTIQVQDLQLVQLSTFFLNVRKSQSLHNNWYTAQTGCGPAGRLFNMDFVSVAHWTQKGSFSRHICEIISQAGTQERETKTFTSCTLEPVFPNWLHDVKPHRDLVIYRNDTEFIIIFESWTTYSSLKDISFKIRQPIWNTHFY